MTVLNFGIFDFDVEFQFKLKAKMISSRSCRPLMITTKRYLSSINPNATHKTDKEYPKRIFSGIQPTGSVHIGNYFGAIKNWVDLQDQGEDVTVSIVDLHSITLPQEPEKLQENILEMTATLLACGIDPEKSILFLQSTVPRHAELCWILSCLTSMARLSHLPQYKEKSENMKEVPLGLFLYPVLQAADILLYKATHVPVGEDQLKHLQMAQQLVKTFNYRYGNVFPHPTSILSESDGSKRVRSLRDPSKKMSKSDTDPKSQVLLVDKSDVIASKFKKAVTDFTPQVTYDVENRPGIANLIHIHCLASNKIPEEVVEEVEGVTTGRYKKIVSDALVEHLEPIQEKIQMYLSKPDILQDILRYGAVKARQRADITYREVYEKVGVGLPTSAIFRKHYLQLK